VGALDSTLCQVLQYVQCSARIYTVSLHSPFYIQSVLLLPPLPTLYKPFLGYPQTRLERVYFAVFKYSPTTLLVLYHHL